MSNSIIVHPSTSSRGNCVTLRLMEKAIATRLGVTDQDIFVQYVSFEWRVCITAVGITQQRALQAVCHFFPVSLYPLPRCTKWTDRYEDYYSLTILEPAWSVRQGKLKRFIRMSKAKVTAPTGGGA